MSVQLPLFVPKTDWSPTPVSKMPSWEGAKRVSVDVETHDPTLKELGPGVRREGFICGIAFAIEDGPAHYLPVKHSEDNLPDDQVYAYLRDQARVFTGDIVGTKVEYDLDYLAEKGVVYRGAKFFRDIGVADVLINENHRSYSLQAIAERHGFSGKDVGLLNEAARQYGEFKKREKVNARKVMAKIPGRFVGPYGIADVKQPLLISRRQERIIEDEDLWQIYNLESKVLPVLVKMRRRGLRFSAERLDGVENWSIEQEKEQIEFIKDKTGHVLNIGGVNKPEALVPILEGIGAVIGKTKKGQPNIDQDVLANIDHPVADAIAWARKVNKLRTTFVNSVRNHAVGDRIHCGFNQIARDDDDGGIKGARYGRLSAEHPNLQQQPARDEFATMWRSIYLPDDGGLWAANDYSQQEPRWLTHYAEVSKCRRAKQAAKAYREDPNCDNHQMMADLTGLPRKEAKIVYLGLCYGMGGPKLARSLGLPTKRVQHKRTKRWMEVAGDEAQAILDAFDKHAPFVRQLGDKAQETAKVRGYIRTACGRKCHFPEDEFGNYDWTQKAMNRLIQGSAADQTKSAMVAADEAGFYLQIQVHDELGQTVDSIGRAIDLADIMREVVPMNVPSKVDVDIGSSWGEAVTHCQKCQTPEKTCGCS